MMPIVDTAEDESKSESKSQPVRLALSVAWASDVALVGASVAFAADDERTFVLGRGADAPSRPEHARACFARAGLRDGALDDARLSREQLRVERVEGSALAVENVGRRALFVRGREVRQVIVRAGDVLTIDGLLVLQCVERTGSRAASVSDDWGFVGESAAAEALRAAVAFARATDGHVLVHGPVGVGKDLVARAIAGDARCDVEGLATLDASAAITAAARAGVVQVEGLRHDEGRARLLDKLAGTRIVATAPAPGAVPVALRSRFRHFIAVPSLAERREDVPLILYALARRALSEPSLAARFLDATGEPRLAPELVEACLMSPLDGGVRTLEALLWAGMQAATDDTVAGPKSVASEAPAEPVVHPELTPETLAGFAQLTRTERVVLQHLALNRTSKEIAKALFVSERTVQNHRVRICEKLALRGHNRLFAVAVALKAKLGPPA